MKNTNIPTGKRILHVIPKESMENLSVKLSFLILLISFNFIWFLLCSMSSETFALEDYNQLPLSFSVGKKHLQKDSFSKTP